MNADGTGIRQVTRLNHDEQPRRVVAGREALAFQSNSVGHFEIYTAALDGTHVRQVTTSATDVIQPAWAPDGHTIAFVAGRRDLNRRRHLGCTADLRQERRLGSRLAGASSRRELGSSQHADRRPARHARHEGEGVRLPPRPRAGARCRRRPDRRRDHGRAADGAGRHARGGRRSGRRRRARARGRRRPRRGRRDDGRGRGGGGLAPPRRRQARRDPRARRLGKLGARHPGDARASRRRAEGDGLDGGLGRHAAVRRRRRHRDDVLGRRHRRGEPDLGADHGQRGRDDRGRGDRPGCPTSAPTAR